MKKEYRVVSEHGVRYPAQYREQLKELREKKLEVGIDYVGKNWRIVSMSYKSKKGAEEHGEKWGFPYYVEEIE